MIVRHDRRLMARTHKAAQSKAKIAEQATALVVGLAGGMPQGIQGSYPVEDSRPRGDQHFRQNAALRHQVRYQGCLDAEIPLALRPI
ncbi:hypothetical protein GQ600_10186 [Phytophthora cactorum]|nr:hypothetical protein GQ600_10186 [Phytophthora cactorum]